jgi:hypothetical protein
MSLMRMLTIVAGCLLMSCATQHQVKAVTRTVEIYKPDGSRQCEPDSGTPLTEMERILTDAGIPVLSSRHDHDCLFRPALCGTATGSINIYEISEDQLSDAQALDFIPYSRLKARCESR